MVFDSYQLLQYFNEANCGILLPLARRVGPADLTMALRASSVCKGRGGEGRVGRGGEGRGGEGTGREGWGRDGRGGEGWGREGRGGEGRGGEGANKVLQPAQSVRLRASINM